MDTNLNNCNCENYKPKVEVKETIEKVNPSPIGSILQDETGATSSKRILGAICTLVLCAISVLVCFDYIAPPEYIIETLAALSFGLLGLSTIDKFSTKKTE